MLRLWLCRSKARAAAAPEQDIDLAVETAQLPIVPNRPQVAMLPDWEAQLQSLSTFQVHLRQHDQGIAASYMPDCTLIYDRILETDYGVRLTKQRP